MYRETFQDKIRETKDRGNRIGKNRKAFEALNDVSTTPHF